MAYAPTMVMVGQYFEKRRALANGLSVCGSGVGNFAIPPLMRFLTDHYGFSQALLILAGIMLHVMLAGALLRPLTAYASRRKAKQQSAKNVSADVGVSSITAVNNSNVELESVSCERIDCGDKSPVQSDILSDESKSRVKDQGGCNRLGKCVVSTLQEVKKLLDWSLFRNTLFLLYAFGIMLMFCGYPTMYIMLPDHAKNRGIVKRDAAFLVSILGLFDLFGRIGFGFIADFNLIPKRYLFMGCSALSGILICFLPLVEGFVGLAVMVAFIGLFAGSFFTLIVVMLAEKLGVHRLHSAFGLVSMFMGASFLFAAPITGKCGQTIL